MNNSVNVGIINGGRNNMNAGVISGGNNNFNQYNHFHQKNNDSKPSSKSTDGLLADVIALLAGIFAVTLIVAVNYLKHYEVIFFWFELALMAGLAPHVLTLVFQVFDDAYSSRDSMVPAGGIALAALLAGLLLMTNNAMPNEVLAVANRPVTTVGILNQTWEVWGRFNNIGHRFILENLGSAMFLTVGLLFSLAFGLQQLIESVGRFLQSPTLLAISNWLHFFKTRGAVVAAGVALVGYLFIAGVFTAQMA